MRRCYQNTNNRYQSANVAAGLSCQRDADTHVTDTTGAGARGVASRRRNVERGHGATTGTRKTAINPRT